MCDNIVQYCDDDITSDKYLNVNVSYTVPMCFNRLFANIEPKH